MVISFVFYTYLCFIFFIDETVPLVELLGRPPHAPGGFKNEICFFATLKVSSKQI